MSGLLGAVGSIAGASIQADAIEDATRMQVQALERQQQFVYQNLSPSNVQKRAQVADIERAQNRLALQAEIDPSLLAARYVSQDQLLRLAQEGAESQGDKLAAQLFEEAAAPEYRAQELSRRLMDRAIEEIEAGATLPPDVQAELVKAGLEGAGTVGAGAEKRGIGGTLVRKLIGNEALALKQARQQQAQQLGLVSQQLAQSRAQLLSQVFPQLKALQTQNVALQGSILEQSNQMVPEVGLGGTDIANLMLARVGATNQLTQSAADAAARGAIQQASAWSQAIGAGSQALGSTLSNVGNYATGQGNYSSLLGAILG